MARSRHVALHDTVATRRRRFVCWPHSATPGNLWALLVYGHSV